ncbi:hypothetical protein [Nostoc sp.]|uniref:hypothetical protein n=1 Tax=Nostoc sp. TaxID=1180 RepID=UPI002FF69B45
MAIIQLLQTLQAFYHLWVIIEVFQVKQTKFIENSVNKVDCRTKQSCDRRIQNIGLKSENIAISGL